MSDDRDLPPTGEETSEAEALRRALDGEPARGEAAELESLARMVRGAAGLEAPLGEATKRAALDGAFAGAARRRRARWLAGLAVAAAALVVLGLLVQLVRAPEPPTMDEAALAGPTDALFEGPFPEDQSPAERLDRIVAARTRGYFAALAVVR